MTPWAGESLSRRRFRGIFPLDCHNLQHEDMDMMRNVEVI
jgi:FtsP/CotA-like multicopper oxidase with cupredoxin domain